ncbi:MAG TPA: hypothetical protein VGI43_04980 [Mucilaginibacter sp.]|jgi:hypothetical protein
MKRIILLTITTLFAVTAFAQVSSEDLAIAQSLAQKQKTDVIKKNIKMSDAQGAAFWPIYDEYQGKQRTLYTERATVMNDYLKQAKTLTGKEADDLANRMFDNEKSLTNLQKSYFKKFSEAIGGVNAVKFYQYENYLQGLEKLSLQTQVPYIGEFSKSLKASVKSKKK